MANGQTTIKATKDDEPNESGQNSESAKKTVLQQGIQRLELPQLQTVKYIAFS